MAKEPYLYKTVIISDVHLGIADSKVKELIRFLKEHPSEKLIMNGDMIDGWRLAGTGKWKKKHTRFIKFLIKIAPRTSLIYIKGNHDEFVDQIAPFGFMNFRILNHYELTGINGKKYYVIHGDIFDSVTKNLVWLSKLGASGYDFLLKFNRIYNRIREKRGLPYKSISKEIKNKVKVANSIISRFETKAVTLARYMGYHGIICGHIHTPCIKQLDQVTYMNSGDWVETMSALVEDHDGNWHIKYYEEKA
jgi:UDP-2,3-diacylglucosamine pyrophosphatase LpxH